MIKVSIADLVHLGGERLVPPDLMALIETCQEAAEDDGPKLVLADALQEAGEEGLEYTLRWMVDKEKAPHHDNRYAYPWLWTYKGDTEYPEHCRLPTYLLPTGVALRRISYLHCLIELMLKLEEVRTEVNIV